MTTYRRLLIVGCWLFTLAALVFVTDTGCGLELYVLLFSAGGLLFFFWLWHSIRFPVAFKDGRALWLWPSVPMALVMLLVLGGTDHGLRCRVWLCERELTEFAEGVRAGNKWVHFPGPGKRVGLFFVHRAGGVGTEVNVMTSRSFFWSYGITYWPDGVPNEKASEYQHLYGPWYRYVEDF